MVEYLEVADKPVVPGLESQEVVYAADQPEYRPLRSLRASTADGRVLTRWSLSEKQRTMIANGSDLYLEVMTFKNPLQPLLLFVADTELSADFVTRDYELGIEEAKPILDPNSQMLSVDYKPVEDRVVGILLARGCHELLDKMLNNVPLTEQEKLILNSL